MIDFLQASVGDNQSASIIIDGEVITILRGDFGTHLKLALTAKDIFSDASPEFRARAMSKYVSAAGAGDVSCASGLEILAAYVELSELNKLTGLLPFMSGNANPDQEPPVYHYDNRHWAMWVHKIASTYGWSRKNIFELPPEEVACYIQEILVSEIDEMDFQRSLTEVSYRYDADSRTSSFIPTPRPAWMVENTNESPPENRVRADMLPVGNVIDLSGLGLIGRENDTKETDS